MVRTSVRATVTRASSGRPMTFGTINDATMAMMTSTTIISISVTPLSRRRRRASRLLSVKPCPCIRIYTIRPKWYDAKLGKVSPRTRRKGDPWKRLSCLFAPPNSGPRRSARPATGRYRRRRACRMSGSVPTRWRCRASSRTSCACRCRSPRIASGRPPPASRSRSSSPSRWRRRTSCWGRSSAGASISSSWWRIATWRSGPGVRPPGQRLVPDVLGAAGAGRGLLRRCARPAAGCWCGAPTEPATPRGPTAWRASGGPTARRRSCSMADGCPSRCRSAPRA